MAIRNGWKKGDWLVIDEESGVTKYASQTSKDYRGFIVTTRYADYEQPQDFIKGFTDPRPLPFLRPSDRNFDVNDFVPPLVGNTTVPTNGNNAAAHIFDVGIGDMIVGNNFVIR